MEETCSNCKYFGGLFSCKRYPPKTGFFNSGYPEVEKWGWCGEWTMKVKGT
jgi:hypothetical protein